MYTVECLQAPSSASAFAAISPVKSSDTHKARESSGAHNAGESSGAHKAGEVCMILPIRNVLTRAGTCLHVLTRVGPFCNVPCQGYVTERSPTCKNVQVRSGTRKNVSVRHLK